jgi:hypothetical protein
VCRLRELCMGCACVVVVAGGVVGATVLLPDPLALSDERLEEWWCGGEQLG